MNNFIDVDFEMIGEKYPKSFEKFLKYGNCSSWSEAGRPYKNIFYDEFGYREYQDFCFCDFENFFDENGIIISIYHKSENNIDYFYNYAISKYETINEVIERETKNYNRFEAQIEAIYKAFEIMEKIN